MNGYLEYAAYALVLGVGATMVMDVWGLIAARVLKFPAPNYALVGRWIGHMPQGRFVHPSIAKSPPILGERMIGWIAHYSIGIAFAAVVLALYGLAWVKAPALWPALFVGIFTVAAPFFLMQPGMGAGIASARTPHPNRARLRSLLTHTVFGLGLYGTARLVSALL